MELVCRCLSLHRTNQTNRGLEATTTRLSTPLHPLEFAQQKGNEEELGWLRPLEHPAKNCYEWVWSELPAPRALQPAAERRDALLKSPLCQAPLELVLGISSE